MMFNIYVSCELPHSKSSLYTLNVLVWKGEAGFPACPSLPCQQEKDIAEPQALINTKYLGRRLAKLSF